MEILGSEVTLRKSADSIPTARSAASRPEQPGAGVESSALVQKLEVDATKAEAATDLEAVQEAVESIGRFLETSSTSLRITVTDELARPIYTVIDSSTNEVVRQIPSEEVVAMSEFLKAKMANEAHSKTALVGFLLVEKV